MERLVKTKILNNYLIVCSLVLLLTANLGFSQSPQQIKQFKTTQKFIKAYNQQNYSGIKKNLVAIVRLLPIKQQLKEGLEPLYKKYGAVKTGKIEYLPKNKLTAEFIYSKDTTDRDFMTFYFNKHGKIRGFTFKQPDYLYPKSEYLNSNANNLIKAHKIDSLLKRRFDHGFNGNVIAVNNGKVIYKKAFGYANYDSKDLLNDSSVFELASCSKQFTAMAIMILAEQGKLKYSDDIQFYIPELPYKGVTIENLLTHTGGLPDYMELFTKHWDKKKIATNADMVALFKHYKPKVDYQPNETYDYSNTGYALLSVIIEKASGMSYAAFLDTSIFKPLDMRHTRVYNTRRSTKEKISNYAYGYVLPNNSDRFTLPDSLKDYDFVRYLDGITGDGTVNTTILDLVKWDKALRENTLVSQTSIDKAFTKYKVKSGKEIPYGYGHQIAYADNKERLVYHGGNWPGYLTMILHFVDRQTMIAVLTNNEYENIQKLTDEITKIVLE